jgi:hypothetical protein
VSPSPSDPIEPETNTALEQITTTQTVQKVVINGQIYMLKDGDLYNIIGQKITM